MPIILTVSNHNNRKQRHRQRLLDHISQKESNKQFNRRLAKAYWRRENPRQNLIEFRSQIERNAKIQTIIRQKETREKVYSQRAVCRQVFV